MLKMGHERIRRGWSRKYVGMRVGVTEEAVRLMENNRRKPSYEVMVKLEDLFNMTHRELFAEYGDAERESKR